MMHTLLIKEYEVLVTALVVDCMAWQLACDRHDGPVGTRYACATVTSRTNIYVAIKAVVTVVCKENSPTSEVLHELTTYFIINCCRELVETGTTQFDMGIGLLDGPDPSPSRFEIQASPKSGGAAAGTAGGKSLNEMSHDEALFTILNDGKKKYTGVNKYGKSIAGETLEQLLEDNVCYDEIATKMELVTTDGGIRKIVRLLLRCWKMWKCFGF
jgi:hypothetical protein